MKKLKSQYKRQVAASKWGIDCLIYPELRSWVVKKFSTKQEKACYYQHEIEHRETILKLRAARGRALAHVNDDLITHVYKYSKSWKHNSKRKHQYVSE